MATFIQEALRACVDNEYVPILQNTVADAMHHAKDVAAEDKMDPTQGQEKDATAKYLPWQTLAFHLIRQRLYEPINTRQLIRP